MSGTVDEIKEKIRLARLADRRAAYLKVHPAGVAIVNGKPVVAGDVVITWHDDGWHGSIVYLRVIRVNAKTLTVENKYGDAYRVSPEKFTNVLKPTDWSPWNEKGR